MAKVIRWQGDGSFDQEVVGESHYQEALRKLAGGERRKHTTAQLICESNNPHDKLAVRVEIGGKTVGHLSSDEAQAHRILLQAGKQAGAIVELPAVIVTGESGVAGVYLSVTEMAARSTLDFSKQSFVRRHFTALVVVCVLLLIAAGAPNNATPGAGVIGLVGLIGRGSSAIIQSCQIFSALVVRGRRACPWAAGNGL